MVLASAHITYLALSGVLGFFVSSEALSQRMKRGDLELLTRMQTQTEEQLRESQSELVEAQRIANVGSWEWNLATKRFSGSEVTYRILGVLDPEPLSRQSAVQLIHPEDEAFVFDALRNAIVEPRGFNIEHRVVTTDGEVRWVRTLGRFVPTLLPPAGKLLGVIQDLTSLKQAQEDRLELERQSAARTAAEEAIHARDDFLSIAAHELRTPLTVLKLELFQLERVQTALNADPSVLWQRTRKLARQVERLSGLVQNLLDVSRLVSGRMELQPELFDLSTLVEETASQAQEQFNKAGTPLQIRTVPHVVGYWDRMRLEQVLDNLLSNAGKYGAGHPVELSTHIHEGTAKLRVRDHGMGISLGDQQRIFGRFERAVPARHFGGMGLGLWIVRQIVEAMGGSVNVKSELGRGSTFEVTLPLAQPIAHLPQTGH